MPRRYFRTDVTEIDVPRTGHRHTRGNKRDHRVSVDDKGRLIIDCPDCDPELEGYGGVTNPTLVPLTFDEAEAAAATTDQAGKVTTELARAIIEMGREAALAKAQGKA